MLELRHLWVGVCTGWRKRHVNKVLSIALLLLYLCMHVNLLLISIDHACEIVNIHVASLLS